VEREHWSRHKPDDGFEVVDVLVKMFMIKLVKHRQLTVHQQRDVSQPLAPHE